MESSARIGPAVIRRKHVAQRIVLFRQPFILCLQVEITLHAGVLFVDPSRCFHRDIVEHRLMRSVVFNKDCNAYSLQYQENKKVEITLYEKKYIPH